MVNKKLTIVVIFLVSLLAVSAVSAADNNTNNIEKTADEVASAGENHLILSENNNAGTFTELQNIIYNASEGSTVSLKNDYMYDDGFNVEGILIDKKLTIDGNGHTIDASNKARAFNITENFVTISNLNIINGFSEKDGGAVFS
ncbi:MAG: hypothetical protein ABS871_02270, partial [Methanobrevibacter sp.]